MDLKSFRKSRGLTQQKAAAELGLKSKSYLSNIESGRWDCPVKLALRIERWSGGQVLARDLVADDVAALMGPEPTAAHA